MNQTHDQWSQFIKHLSFNGALSVLCSRHLPLQVGNYSELTMRACCITMVLNNYYLSVVLCHYNNQKDFSHFLIIVAETQKCIHAFVKLPSSDNLLCNTSLFGTLNFWKLPEHNIEQNLGVFSQVYTTSQFNQPSTCFLYILNPAHTELQNFILATFQQYKHLFILE